MVVLIVRGINFDTLCLQECLLLHTFVQKEGNTKKKKLNVDILHLILSGK